MAQQLTDDELIAQPFRETTGLYLGNYDVVSDLLRGLAHRSVLRWSTDTRHTHDSAARVTKEEEADIDGLAVTLLGGDEEHRPVPKWNEPGGIDGWLLTLFPNIKPTSAEQVVEIAIRLFLNDLWMVIHDWVRPGADDESQRDAAAMIIHQWTAIFLGIDERMGQQPESEEAPKAIKKTIQGMSGSMLGWEESPEVSARRLTPAKNPLANWGRGIATPRHKEAQEWLRQRQAPAVGPSALLRASEAGVAPRTHAWLHAAKFTANAPLPTDDELRDLSRYVGRKPVQVHRLADRDQDDEPKNGHHSWVRDRAALERWLQEHPDQPLRIMSRTVQPEEILVDYAMLPPSYGKLLDGGLGEVVVATGALRNKIAQMRAKPRPNARKTWEPKKRGSLEIVRGSLMGFQEVKAHDFSRDGGPEDDAYVYHVTTPERAEKILNEGFRPNMPSSMAPGFWRDYSRGKLFFSDKAGVEFWKDRVQQHLEAQTDDEVPELTVLRIPKEHITNLEEDQLGTRDANAKAYFVRGNVKLAPGVVRKGYRSTDGFFYHATSKKTPIESFARHGILPSKDGADGPGVYLAEKIEGTHDHVSPEEARYFRVPASALIAEFGKYPQRQDGLQYDEHEGHVLLDGNRSIPPHLVEVLDDGRWLPVQSHQQAGPRRKSVGGLLDHNKWNAAETSSEHVYHATSEHNLDSIRREGLLVHKPWHGTDQDAWPDGSTESRSYFATSPGSAFYFAPADGKPVLLRIRRDAAKLRPERTGDWYSTRPVHAAKLELAMDDGTWQPLASVRKTWGLVRKSLEAGPPTWPRALHRAPEHMTPKERKAATAELLAAYAADERVRGVADVLSAFTQGEFRHIREVASHQAQGTYSDVVHQDRTARLQRLASEKEKGKEIPDDWYEDLGPIWAGWADISTIDGKMFSHMSHTRANEAVADLQDAIAHAPVYEEPVYRGAYWSHSHDEGWKAYERGDFDQYNMPTKDGNGKDPADGWQYVNSNRMGYDHNYARPPKQALQMHIAPDFQVGGEIEFPAPVSFTRDPEVAHDFAWKNDIGQRGRGTGRKRQSPEDAPRMHRYVFKVEGGSKGVHADQFTAWKKQKEFVTNGRFVIKDIRSSKVGKSMLHEITLEQKAVFGGKKAELQPLPEGLKPYDTKYQEPRDA